MKGDILMINYQIGSIRICELSDNVKIGETFKDQHGRIWIVLEQIDFDRFKCKLIDEGENNKW
jgi:hypothetical protein